MHPSDATSAHDPFVQARSAAAAFGFDRFDHIPETGSTNADLAERARSGDASSAVLVTDHQRAGRGRMDRTWTDIPGSQLLVSFLFAEGTLDPYAYANSVALAARAAVSKHVEATVAMKWPNDLLVTDGAAPGKLAGVLGEVVSGANSMVVVGIGCNLVPVSIEGSTSVAASGGTVGRDQLLAELISGLAKYVPDRTARRVELVAHSATIGMRVRVVGVGGDLVGDAVGIDDDGCLLVDPGTGPVAVAAGDAIHLRPAE